MMSGNTSPQGMSDFSKLMLSGGMGSALGGFGGFIGNMFGGDPTKGAMRNLNQIPDVLKQYLMPYISGMSDPNELIKKIGGGYKESPGFKFGLDQALRASNSAAAAGGMAGSPQAQQQAQEVATQLQNQDYNNYLDRALGVYGQGAGMSQNLATALAQALMSKAGLKYSGDVANRQGMMGSLGNIAGGAASILPFLML